MNGRNNAFFFLNSFLCLVCGGELDVEREGVRLNRRSNNSEIKSDLQLALHSPHGPSGHVGYNHSSSSPERESPLMFPDGGALGADVLLWNLRR